MARNQGTAITNSFSRGIIDQAHGLNFPENAVTDAENVRFHPVGYAERRKGFDLEASAQALVYDRSHTINEYVWNTVAANGANTYLVIQVDDGVFFYQVQDGQPLSAGRITTFLDLQAFRSIEAPAYYVEEFACHFSSGDGYLVITHPFVNPVFVYYDDDLQRFRAGGVVLLTRDFEGVNDGLETTENPVNLSDEHHYNLRNQGWNQDAILGGASQANAADTGNNLNSPVVAQPGITFIDLVTIT